MGENVRQEGLLLKPTALKKNLASKGVTAIRTVRLGRFKDTSYVFVAKQHLHLKRSTKSYSKRLIKKLKARE